ncbi:hypothetical protein [Acinetobacter sp. B51(2017)]|uniref:hypothetical protein n=1 Tax=Acinetobacter sp. B51(2017) TaxID=2060938 RepID=UPI0013DFFD1E|nr:hypothetical protein [Acinetobacter sp. B51(2017)]
MHWGNYTEGRIGSMCQYNQQQQRRIAVEHYKIEQAEKVVLSLRQADCLKD